MSSNSKIIKYGVIFSIVLLLCCTSCATSRQTGRWSKEQEAYCQLSHNGKNNYYFSGNYQRKLKKNEL